MRTLIFFSALTFSISLTAQDTCDYMQYFKSCYFNFTTPPGWKLDYCIIDSKDDISTINFIPSDSTSFEKFIQIFVMGGTDTTRTRTFLREVAFKDSIAMDSADKVDPPPSAVIQFKKEYPRCYDEKNMVRKFGIISIDEPLDNSLCVRSIAYYCKDWIINVRYNCTFREYKEEFKLFETWTKGFGFPEDKKFK